MERLLASSNLTELSALEQKFLKFLKGDSLYEEHITTYDVTWIFHYRSMLI